MATSARPAPAVAIPHTDRIPSSHPAPASSSSTAAAAAAAAAAATTSSAARKASTSTSIPSTDRAAESDDELNALSTTHSRDRLGSESSSRASRKNFVTHNKAGSATSKSSAGSTRRRQDSLKRGNAGADPSTTPKRGTPPTARQHTKTLDAFAPLNKERKGSQFRVGNVGAAGRIYLTPVTKPSNGPSSPVQSPQSRARHTLRLGLREDEVVIEEEGEGKQSRSEQTHRAEKELGEAVEDSDQADDDDNNNKKNKNGNERLHQHGQGDDALLGSALVGANKGAVRDSVWTKLSNNNQDVRGAPSDIFRHRPRSQRSMSESTANRVVALTPQNKPFKVVIDRPDSDPAKQQQQQRHQSTLGHSFNGLDIHIPNYEMGSPQFSDQGTPFLHSSSQPLPPSAITQSQFLERIPDGVPLPPPTLGPSPLKRPVPASLRRSHTSPYTQSIGSMSYDSIALQTNAEPSPVSRQHSVSASDNIVPAIYDILAAAPNDPSVVRYSTTTGDMIAATPARLIVQITAETFLDYELLSDFFLTVRSYLPIHDLMSLLLARFEWAVNRFDDNGRIIRVRSFAAIRHWILNYFAYDFVPDRRLRVQFCRKLNQLFKVVQSQREYGLPDLKLISDLKKCWNGRCVLYWERDQAIDNEADLLPGGPGLYDLEDDFEDLDDDDDDDDDGEEDEEEDDDDLDDAALGSVTAASTDDFYSEPGSPRANLSNGAGRGVRKSSIQDHGQSRNGSGSNVAGAPMSPNSETGASPISSAKKLKSAQKSGNKQHSRQSGGSSDIMRNDFKADQPQQQQQQHQQPAQAATYPLQPSAYRSVLRGHLLAPASPYVTTATATPGFQRASPILGPTNPEPPARRNVNSGVNSAGPGMKAIIGNIKRALSSKVSSGAGLPLDHAILMEGAAGISRDAHKNIEAPGRNASSSAESGGHGNSSHNHQPSATGLYAEKSVRAAMRIDVLAEQISIEFQKALQGQYRQPARYDEHQQARLQQQEQQQRLQQQILLIQQQHQQEQEQLLQQQQQQQQQMQMQKMSWLSPGDTKQVPSGMTSSSQSIFIIDATGDADNKPVQDDDETDGRTPRVSVNGAVTANNGHLNASDSNHLQVSTREIGSAATSNAATPSRLSLAEPTAHLRQVSHSSTSLRRVASYQSALNRPSVESSRLETTEEMVPDPSTGGKTMMPASGTPQKGLRRVPGGDLRANQNIADLEGGPLLPRPKSTGSIATYASTAYESEMLSFGDRITKTFRDRNDRPLISPGVAGSFAAPFKKNNTDRDTVSTKATKVSYIRSQSDDHTGRRPSFEALVKSFADIPDEDEGGPEATLLKLEGRYHKGAGAAARLQAAAKAAREQQQQRQSGATTGKKKKKQSTNSTDTLNAKQTDRSTLASTDYAYSDSSFNSIPLRERESMASPKSKGKGVAGARARSGTDRRSVPRSFLLDDMDDSGSEVFTEDSRRPSNSHMQQQQQLQQQQGNGGFGSPPANGVKNQYLPTPDMSPNRNFVERHIGQTGGPTSNTHPAIHAPLGGSAAQPKHMPFVLGHDSKVLCEQLTLIEKDALREIDWRDLVDMRWQQKAPSITNWVSYLMSSNPLGIDLVTARFNIMVKWVQSEIVLTESEAERALVIVKFIHIAREARRICNYATLLQFTIALTSNDCLRMKKTWALVPKVERDALQELESLVSPRKNFVGLRSEMEDAPADQGCIPVLAVYIHDLVFNAQKPHMVEADLGLNNSTAAGKSQTRHLINFERYRNTAFIVKGLLRLIDASSRYNFVPVDDVLSHCMWISSLPDETITARSKVIEGLAASAQQPRNMPSLHLG